MKALDSFRFGLFRRAGTKPGRAARRDLPPVVSVCRMTSRCGFVLVLDTPPPLQVVLFFCITIKPGNEPFKLI